LEAKFAPAKQTQIYAVLANSPIILFLEIPLKDIAI
jgi:hypothetical protein